MASASVETLIVGAGLSGICLAIKLLEAGRTSFLLVEKSEDIGGTWSVNGYPGCCCDVPSHLYSFSFDQNPSWSKMYADRSEIHHYLKSCVQRHGVVPHVRFNTVARAAVWDDAAAHWRVDVSSDDVAASTSSTINARFLVRAIGGLHVPKYPVLKGIERFAGLSFHSSAWHAGVDLRDKIVAVIGTGASAVQIVPEIAPITKKLYLCQRTPAWILPKLDFSIAHRWRRLFGQVPVLMWLFSLVLYCLHEVLAWAFWSGQRLRRVGEMLAKMHMQSAIRDPVMRASLVPTYELGCKRVLLSSTFYPALARPNVELVTASILEVRERSIVFRTDESAGGANMEKDVDVIIHATGFDPLNPKLRVVGTTGVDLKEAGWATMLGVTKQGFPNLFMLLGPNTGLGHTSQILMVEAQVRYIISCIKLVTPPARSMELRGSSQHHFQDLLARRFHGTVWRPGGCNSWYLDPHNGHNPCIWPASTLEYIYRTHSASPSHYHFR